MVCDDSSDWAILTSGLLSACYPMSVFRCSPYARRCTGSCHLGRRADGWGLRGGGSAAELAGCHLGRSKGRRSGSRSHRRKQTGRGWSQSRRWCRFGLASSLQRGQESAVWQEFFFFFKQGSQNFQSLPLKTWLSGSLRTPNYITKGKIFLKMASSQICIIWFFLNSNPFPKSCSLSLLKKTFVACFWHEEVDLRVWPSLPMSRKIVFEINHTFLHYLQLLIPTELMRTTEKTQKGGF